MMSSRPTYPQSIHHRFTGLLITLGIIFFAGCSSVPSESPSTFQEGQLFDLQQHVPVTFDEMIQQLLTADVIYIGEEHYNPSHVETAIRLINTLDKLGKQPALAMEMLSWDGQEALNHWIEGTLPADQFVQAARWEENWGGNFANYQPLVELARARHFPLLGLNPPRTLVRIVAKQGLTQGLLDPAMDSWDLPQTISLEDPDYRRVIYDQIVQCHPELPPQVYQHIFEASIFRDEGMAKVIVDYLQTHPKPAGPLVSYTGGGHIQYNIPIPKRVQARTPETIRQATIYLMAFDPAREDEIQEAMDAPIADYLWLTPLGPNGPQPRCG